MTLLEGQVALLLAGLALVFLAALVVGPRWARWLDRRELDAAFCGQRPDIGIAEPAMPVPVILELRGLSVDMDHETEIPEE